jgi:glycosyltransferase involved in cell wall biosynthesis
MPRHSEARNVLAAHVVGHDEDLRQALDRRPARVVAPSATVLAQAAARGYDTTGWAVVPNTLLSVPAPADPADRERLRVAGPVRVLARLGPEKGVAQLLAAPTGLDRPVHVALAAAPFELTGGSQHQLLQTCHRLAAATPGVTIRPGMPWHEVPAWLGDAALVVVPSLAETFGLVALEAMAAGTPVIAYDVGNLPDLVADGGIIVTRDDGPAGLWRAARQLLHDPVLYTAKSRAAYYRSRDYWPAHIADQLLKVVS